MADLTGIEAAQSVKLIGAESDGTEQTPVESTDDGELTTVDTANHGGADKVLAIPADSTLELKITGSVQANRKYVQIQAQSRDITWGFSPTTTSFNAFKDQFFILPFGAGTTVYIKNNHLINAANVAIAEIS